MAKSSKSKGQSGVKREHDLPWSAKKVAVFKALRSPKLKGGEGSAAELIKVNPKLTGRDIRHYCYHGAAGGLVAVVPHEEGEANGYRFKLTAKGRTIDPDKALAEQQANRKSASKPKATKKAKAKKSKKSVKKVAKTEPKTEPTAVAAA